MVTDRSTAEDVIDQIKDVAAEALDVTTTIGKFVKFVLPKAGATMLAVQAIGEVALMFADLVIDILGDDPPDDFPGPVLASVDPVRFDIPADATPLERNLYISGARICETGRLAVASARRWRGAEGANADPSVHREATRAAVAAFQGALRTHAAAVRAWASELDADLLGRRATSGQVAEVHAGIRDDGAFPDDEEAIFRQLDLTHEERAGVVHEALRSGGLDGGESVPLGDALRTYVEQLVRLSRADLAADG